VGIDEKEHALVVEHRRHRCRRAHPRIEPEHVNNVVQLALVAADGAAQHGIDFAALGHQCGDHGGARAHDRLGVVGGHPAPPHDLVIKLPVFGKARVVVDIGQLEIHAFADAQAKALDAHRDHRWPADQDRAGEAFIDHGLHRAQHGFFFALGVRHAFEAGARLLEYRLHQQAGAEHVLRELLAIGCHVRDRAGGDAGVHRRLRDGRRQLHQQARIERARNQVLGAEYRHVAAIGRAQIGGFLSRQRRDRLDAGQLHRLVDGRCTDVERAAENVRETQGVIDLIRVIRTAGGDDAIGTGGARRVGIDLGIGIGQREDDRLRSHLRQHLGLEDPARREAQKDVGAIDHFRKRARLGVARVAQLGAFQIGALAMQNAVMIHRTDVIRIQAQCNQHVQAGNPGRADTGGGHAHVLDLLADHFQRIEHRRTDDDRGAVLVIVEHRDFHPLAQLALDDETFGCLDVLQVDAAEGGLQAGDDLDQLVRIVLLHFDVEHIDAGEFLEQHALAFHHRLGRQRPDVAQPQHRSAIADHRHQIAARGERARLARILDDGLARGGHTGRIGQRQIALGNHRLGRNDLDLASRKLAVVFKGGKFQVFVGHGGSQAGRAGCVTKPQL